MEIQIQELDYCKLQVSCSYDAEEIGKKKKEVLKIFKDAPVPGFRKGKATVKVIQNYYHLQIQDALKKALAEEALHQSMFEKQYKPLTPPQYKEIFLQPEKFSCQFVVDKKPDFELTELDDLEIPMPVLDMTEESYVQNMLQNLRVSHGDKIPFNEEQFTEMGDVVSITYKAFIDEQIVDELSSSSEGDIITIGNSNVKDFDQNILQMKIGDTREFSISLPETNISKYAGKTVTFKVSLNMAMKVIPCPLDDSLAKKLNKSSYQDLLKEISAAAFAQVQNQTKTLKLKALINKLVSMHDFKIPEWLVAKESEYLASSNKIDLNTLPPEIKAAYIDQASKNLRLSLVLEKIRESDPETQLSDQEAFQMVSKYLSESGKEIESMMKDLNKIGYLQVLYNRLKDDYTLEQIVNKAKFI